VITIEEIIDSAKEYVLRFGEHPPTLYAKGTLKKVVIPFDRFPDTHENKVLFLAHAGRRLAQKGTIGTLTDVFFVSEAWIGIPKKDGSFIQPSRDPKRKEVVIISGLDVRTDTQSLAVLAIVRGSNGELRELKETPFPKDGEVKSPLLPAFVLGYTFGTSAKKR